MTSTIGQYQRHLAQFPKGNLGTAATIDFVANGVYQSGVLNSASCTLTFVNPLVHSTVWIELIQDVTGGRAVVFPGSVVGPVPPINTTGNASTLLEMVWNGTNYQFTSTASVSSPVVTTTPPVNVTKAAAAVGTSTDAARADHKHDVTTAAAVSTSTTNAEGTATTLARSDHTHAVTGLSIASEAQGDILYRGATAWVRLAAGTSGSFLKTQGPAADPVWDAVPGGLVLTSAAPVNVTKAAASAGVATDAARSDHKHDVSTAAAVSTSTTNAEGVATTLARSDHTHAVTGLSIASEAQGDILYRNATAWVRLAAGTNGTFLKTQGPAADPVWAAIPGGLVLTTNAPVNVTKAAASVGVATDAARSDHKHDVSTAAASGAVAIGNAGAEGTATTLARSDHVHPVAAAGVPVNVGTANSAGVATTFAASDHVHNVPFSAVNTALAAANASISINNQKITSVLDPTLAQDAATKAYVDAVSQGLLNKLPVLTVATTNISTLSGLASVINGIALNTDGQRVGLTQQTPQSANGIYVVHAGAWTRATDMPAGSHGSCVFFDVQAGTLVGNGYLCVADPTADLVGTNNLPFLQVSGNLIATLPIVRTGSVLSLSTASAVSIGAVNSAGTASTAALSDHTHAVTDLALASQAQGDLAFFNGSNWVRLAAGTSGQFLKTQGAAANPTWAATVAVTTNAPTNVTKSLASAGIATDAARSDHKHDVLTAAAISIGSTNAEGTATTLARSDHTHAVTGFSIASQAQGDVLYFDGTSWARLAAGTNGNVLTTHGAAANPTWTAPVIVTTAAPVNVTKAAAAVGTATDAARSDHKHDVSTAAAVTISTTNAEGTATTLARSDHTHNVSLDAANIADASSGVGGPTVKDSLASLLTQYDSVATKTANYTFALADAKGLFLSNSASALTFTVPLNSTVAFKLGTKITVININTGAVVFSGAAGVTIHQPATLPAAQFMRYELEKIATDTWNLSSIGVLSSTDIVNASTVTGSSVGAALDNLLLEYQSSLIIASNHTLTLADVGTALGVNSAGSITITVPAHSTTAFRVGSRVSWLKLSTGPIVVSPAVGVSIISAGPLPTKQYTVYHLDYIDISTDSWLLTAESSLSASDITNNSNLAGVTVADALNDLTSDNISNQSSVTGVNVSDALNNLQTATTTATKFALQGQVVVGYSFIEKDSGWTFFTAQGWQGNGTGANITFQIGPVPPNATVTGVSVYFKPTLSHSSGGLPANRPSITVYVGNAGASATAHSATDSSTLAFYDSLHAVSVTGLSVSGLQPIWVQFTDESGTHALPGNQLYIVTMQTT